MTRCGDNFGLTGLTGSVRARLAYSVTAEGHVGERVHEKRAGRPKIRHECVSGEIFFRAA